MISTQYDQFLQSKRRVAVASGFDIMPEALNPMLFDWQKQIVVWALHRGRAAIFADCGMGKTLIQLEWAYHVHKYTGGRVLILAPLAVAAQTVREGAKFGINVTHVRTAADLTDGIMITNYERLHLFQHEEYAGLVADESSILKGFGGPVSKEIIAFGHTIPYRLACTATPAPNDLIELTNHSEFLDIMAGKEIIALYFTQDGNTTHHWRLKGHAKKDFYIWLASWSVALRRPSDLGAQYSDEGYVLPPLHRHQIITEAPQPTTTLFAIEAQTLPERQQARRDSIDSRVAAVAELVNGNTEAWIVWCNLNKESEALRKAIPDAVEVTGSDTPEFKEQAVLDFVDGRTRVLISKPSITGFGINMQHCHNMAFVGLSDSYEQLYQATRRCWRFGQTQPVNAYLITAETEGAVVRNIERKEAQASEMINSIVEETAGLSLGKAEREEMVYEEDEARGERWRLLLGDSVRRLDAVEADSVGLTVTSPPFPGMYAYTNSAHDMGNVKSIDEMIAQFQFLVPQLLRVTMPGRLCCIHLTQITAMKSREGYIGIQDYRGRTIEAMNAGGWIFAGEVTIEKNPQIQAVRNKERGLLFKSLATDSSVMRMALADYLLYFRKPGENPHPIRAGISEKYGTPNGWITEKEWIEWASPVWHRHSAQHPGGIRETNVLNVAQARETDDERHLCPLQLDVIERAVKLWSAPGDLVLDPFNGIGSVGVKSLELGRRYVGVELKRSYFNNAVKHLTRAEESGAQPNFLDMWQSDDVEAEAASSVA